MRYARIEENRALFSNFMSDIFWKLCGGILGINVIMKSTCLIIQKTY